MTIQLNQLVVGIKGAGEMASAVAWRLYSARIEKIFMMEIACPLAVRRAVSFCEAVHDGNATIEAVAAQRTGDISEIQTTWDNKRIAVLIDPHWTAVTKMRPHVVVDAILAKKNIGTTIAEAPLVIGLGPGFRAPVDVHMVVETNRGHNLGRIITTGSAEENTGIPGSIDGYTEKRVLRAPVAGKFTAKRSISDRVKAGEIIGTVSGEAVHAEIGGVIRGLIRNDIQVPQGLKIGDIDPRGERSYCFSISDKARAIAGSVLEAVLRVYNT